MNTIFNSGAHTSAPVPESSHAPSEWLTVQEAVARCQMKGLARTPKTVRKWAQASLSAADGTGDVVVQRQDTENGFRYLISRASLDVKIGQEMAFDEHSGAHTSEPVETGVHLFPQVLANDEATEPVRTAENMSAQVHTGAQPQADYLELLKTQLDRAQHQLDMKDKQIDALLERDRETNFLIQGLQTSLTQVVKILPGAKPPEPETRDAG